MASPVDTSPGPPVVVKHDPEELGMYIIVSDIAAGTFGTVKKAIHKVTGHRVALKFLSKAAVANNGMKTRVRREFEYTRMLRHPHIIKLSMLVLDPFQRITIPEIMKHPWFTVDLPRYLTPLPPIPGAVVGTLSSLVAPPVVPLDRDLEYVEGLGRIDDEVVDELVELLEGVDKEEVLHSLRRDDGSRGNQVKVAYMLLQDKRRVGKDLAIVSELEREAELASMDPRNAISPNAVSPNGGDVDENPFEAEFEEDIDDVDDELIELAEDEVDVPSRFSILGSSLPAPDLMNSGRRRHKKRSKWQFGIRSSSPPLKVLKEIYAQLKAMDMEWKYRHDLSDIFCIEARARVRDFVILMNINLYDTKQHLGLEYYRLDFVHKKSYRASTLPGAGKYDAAPREGSESESITRSYARSVFTDGLNDKKTILSPFIFMELAAELILNLAASNAND
ncbi:unnamed protein product [Mycena citricolor]|uniref:non-specific serine/threonine protein kinase n=1 Tax=Mycena citricolor TaxID=2018698 RepID=A0AAD2HB35_9AGAR|nr:unnamed protein product [Mycena citricolor]